MNGMIQIGPLVIGIERLVAFALIWLFLSVGALVGRRTLSSAGRAAGVATGLGLIASRIGFVLRHWEAFAPDPWSMLAIWQGGFALWPGVIIAALTLLVLLGRASATLWMLATLVSFTGLFLAASPWLTPAPRPLPAGLVIADMASRPISIDRLRGQPMVVNLWATWCPPCRREMPMLVDASSRSTVAILLVNQGEDVARVRAYLRGNGLAEDAVRIDPLGKMGQQIATRALPTTLFIDANGEIIRTHVGELSRAALSAGIHELERAR